MTRVSRGAGFVCSIVPPYLLDQFVESGDPDQRAAAQDALRATALLRRRRTQLGALIAHPDFDVMTLGLVAAGTHSAISVYDGHGLSVLSPFLPGELRRGPDDPPFLRDRTVDEAYDSAGETIAFYREVFDRNGLDDAGMDVVSSVHVVDPAGRPWDNAAWNGNQMCYGDGGILFVAGAFTTALEVIGHEFTHGVTEFSAGLEYHDQPGALNESMSDVFGSMIKQHALGQTSAEADWLIGPGLLADPRAKALRSVRDPGTAFPGDPQPATMADYNYDPADDGGVHTNSGIPNRAFYLAAWSLGGHSWEVAGKIWYRALTSSLSAQSQFADAAQATMDAAQELFPDGETRDAIGEAWHEVGVI